MANSELSTKVKKLTDDSGVYLMKDNSGEILYVGKAKNLKNRVSTYFQESHVRALKSPRIELLVKKIHDFDIIITDNEVEALILECNLIKKHRPRFNVRLRDDKSYPFVKMDLNHPYPRLEYTRKVKKNDGARYFGPYISSFQIKEVLHWAKKTFKLRDCTDNEFRNRSRPCILYQMNQCSAPCVKNISQEDYHHSIEQVLRVLDGKTDKVLADLKTLMAKASEQENYEFAAEIRDRIQAIEDINQEQKMHDPESVKSRDVVQFSRSNQFAVVVILSIREGKTVGVESYPYEDLDPTMSDEEFVIQFLTQFYVDRHETAASLMPAEIMLPEAMENLSDQILILNRALGKKYEFRIPKRGENADLVAMVKKTANFQLEELVSKRTSTIEDLIDVQKKLHLKNFPNRIECYDISHFQGEGTVASRVVLIDGIPEKSLYRHYHVRDVQGVDDFKSMKEILSRRFEKSGTGVDPKLPDLVLIDGGKGQLAQAEAVFQELGVLNVDLCSIAKARTESKFEATEIKSSSERIFKPNQKNFILLKAGTGAFRILTHARDEAHRFAISFHRKIRDKQIIHGKE